MKQHRILYIEDEAHLARIVKESLERKGYEVLHRKDGTRVLEHIQSFTPDACVLDVMLPHIDGFTLGSMIRSAYPKLPIIFLTAKSQTSDVLAGFSSGGTDYLRKPFSMEELIVRLENQIRMSASEVTVAQSMPSEVALGMLRFFPARYELRFADGRTQKLSHREAQLLGLLVQHSNRPVDRRLLLQAIWGDDSFFNSRNLDVYIRKLREYFATDPDLQLITLKGQGYHFIVPGVQ
jgi:DNA-binding response OmpR family regulator